MTQAKMAVSKPLTIGGFRSLEAVREVCRNMMHTNMALKLSREQFEHILKLCDAFWIHNNDPRRPHAELTAGDCSNGFIDTLRMLKYPEFNWLMAYQLVRRIRENYGGSVDWVIGSDHAGATFSYEVARLLGAKHDFTEKGPGKTQIWKRHVIEPGEVVLQVEELVTTTLTLQAVRDGITEGKSHPVKFAPVVATLVHRPDPKDQTEGGFQGGPIVNFQYYEVSKWKPTECPLCAVGSERVRPKENWAKLVGK